MFSKNVLNQTWKSLNIKVHLQRNDGNSSYQVWEVLVLFYNLVALTLGWKCMKGQRVTKTLERIKFEGVCGELIKKFNLSKMMEITVTKCDKFYHFFTT